MIITCCIILLCTYTITANAQVKKTTTPAKPKTIAASTIKKTVAKPKPVINKNAATTTAKKPVVTKNVKPATATKTATPPVLTKPTTTKPAAPTEAELAKVKPSNRESHMIDEINLLRSNPPDYIRYINEFIKKRKLSPEAKVAADELKEQLITLKPLSALTLNPAIYLEAKTYGKAMIKNNIIEHSDLPYRENISFGTENIRDNIIDLLIDDDEPERGHRKNLLNKRITQVAIHELPGKVEDYNYCFIQEFK